MVTIIREVLLSIDSKSGGLASFFQGREHVPPAVIILRAGGMDLLALVGKAKQVVGLCSPDIRRLFFTARRIRTLVRKQIYLSSF